MYTEGMADLNGLIMVLPLCPPDQKDQITLIRERTTDHYLPVFEKWP
ncbi:Glutathione S-transferase A2 [Vulpes lagopus]